MSVTVGEFIEKGSGTLSMEVESGADYLGNAITEEAINRPGLALAGFYQHFPRRRLQVLGLAENAYLKSLDPKERLKRMSMICKSHIPALVVTRSRHPFPEVIQAAEKHNVPILRSSMITSHFVNAATLIMEQLVAPQIRYQGTMLDMKGVGVLLEGKPGIGKSETALSLIERGNSLVSDDITLLRVDAAGHIVGSAVDITRYHMEIRGIGIVHIPSLFGVSSMRRDKKLDLVIQLHPWDPKDDEERVGMSTETKKILNVDVPYIQLPVAPGRDMAHVIEVAALNYKLKLLGHDAAKELDEKLVALLTGS